MSITTSVRSLPASAVRRWRGLGFRSRVGLVLLAIAVAVGTWAVIQSFPDTWPARAVLKTPRDTWPLAFSPDGRTFVTSIYGQITPWDVATGRKGEPWVIPDDRPAVIGAFSPDGRTFAAAIVLAPPDTLLIYLFDTSTRKIRASSTVSHPSLYALRFADDGRTLRAFLGGDGDLKEVVTWDVETGRQLSRRPLSAPTKIGITAISADGRTTAIVPMGSRVVELWDLDADKSLGSVRNPNSTSLVSWGGVGLSADGRTLAVARVDGTLELWNLPAQTLRTTLKAYPNGSAGSGLRFSPDGRTLAADVDRLPETSTVGQILHSIRQAILGRRREESEIVVTDLTTGRRLARTADAIHPYYSPDGRTIATRERDLSVKLRDLPPIPK